ncbi:geranylgeranyl diphosphate synthase type I [Kribbella orskensis]|uniref:Geranylgeranyl diphosphate synthase type I n=1 Tax=Kribbella orskensis TaxID=2512216 RepID=A0ABY2BME0_9ACTN|nr:MULTISPECIES: polyprenyl synthetase family protein [Kribbella]TCN41716.1 geranylgeranyl diphosphate synthase type I [Kribbella sp. VKM Ac-2500]TCO25594.1 geranylgeranyl diphosphate synthase type I [Kribbella orskensis]
MTITAETLDRSRGLVAPALRLAVERLDPFTRLVVSYHLGWSDEHGTPTVANPGKTLRPALALLAAEAVTGRPEPGLPGAVAVELVHNFSLLHDDLMDRDTERRHRRTVWAVWGDATAVLAGDALLSLAHEVLTEGESPDGQAAGRALAVATRELIRGQVLDLAFEQRNDVGLDECLDMAAGKTGALLGVSAAIGAILVGASQPVVSCLSRFGAELGMAFQLVDDLLGIWGSPEVTGKPVFSDLVARKKTLPVTWSLDHGGEAGRELAAWLRRDDAPTDGDLRYAAQLIERSGGRDWAVQEARDRIGLAEQALDQAGLDGGARSRLGEIARFVIERQS